MIPFRIHILFAVILLTLTFSDSVEGRRRKHHSKLRGSEPEDYTDRYDNNGNQNYDSDADESLEFYHKKQHHLRNHKKGHAGLHRRTDHLSLKGSKRVHEGLQSRKSKSNRLQLRRSRKNRKYRNGVRRKGRFFGTLMSGIGNVIDKGTSLFGQGVEAVLSPTLLTDVYGGLKSGSQYVAESLLRPGPAGTEADSTTEVPWAWPTAEDPSTEAPATDGSITEVPWAWPTAEDPSTEAPATDGSITEVPWAWPSAEDPSTEAPEADGSITETPASENTITEAPATENSITETPGTEETITEVPATEEANTEALILAEDHVDHVATGDEPDKGSAPPLEHDINVKVDEPVTKAPASGEEVTTAGLDLMSLFN